MLVQLVYKSNIFCCYFFFIIIYISMHSLLKIVTHSHIYFLTFDFRYFCIYYKIIKQL